jgi:hypothetical protein
MTGFHSFCTNVPIFLDLLCKITRDQPEHVISPCFYETLEMSYIGQVKNSYVAIPTEPEKFRDTFYALVVDFEKRGPIMRARGYQTQKEQSALLSG